jgi:hypothetical protein
VHARVINQLPLSDKIFRSHPPVLENPAKQSGSARVRLTPNTGAYRRFSLAHVAGGVTNRGQKAGKSAILVHQCLQMVFRSRDFHPLLIVRCCMAALTAGGSYTPVLPTAGLWLRRSIALFHQPFGDGDDQFFGCFKTDPGHVDDQMIIARIVP